MAENKEKSYWPHMILGFLLVGITLGYWTVKHAVSLPVQEVNNYMLKYQQADMNINKIIKDQALFDKSYKIELIDVKKEKIPLENVKWAKSETDVIVHNGKNSFKYRVLTKSNQSVDNAKVTFLLTRPHTQRDDVLKKNIASVNGTYIVKDIDIKRAGRYTLQIKVVIGDKVGYLEIPAYLKS